MRTAQRLTSAAIAALACAAASAVLATAAPAANVIGDGGFESATPTANGSLDSPSWIEDDTIYGSPLCGAGCGNASGTIGPNQGHNWALFGARTPPGSNMPCRSAAREPGSGP